jgi:hypothetical protein
MISSSSLLTKQHKRSIISSGKGRPQAMSLFCLTCAPFLAMRALRPPVAVRHIGRISAQCQVSLSLSFSSSKLPLGTSGSSGTSGPSASCIPLFVLYPQLLFLRVPSCSFVLLRVTSWLISFSFHNRSKINPAMLIHSASQLLTLSGGWLNFW